MSGRVVRAAVAQSGPIPDAATREENVARLVAMLRDAHAQGAEVVLFTECALTAFFPHWDIPLDQIDRYFEREMPNAATAPLFAEAKRLGVGFCLGYAELAEEAGTPRHYNTCILVDGGGEVVGKYRKTHLPGYYVPDHAGAGTKFSYQNLEKRYFDPGNLGWGVWDAWGGRFGMAICNDRRWAETYRVMGLQGVECVMLGYNTPVESPSGRTEPPHLSMFQNHLSMQAGAYQNATWVLAAAKAGEEEGVYQIGGSCIISPTGEIVAQATTDLDEVIVADVDLDACRRTNMSKDGWSAYRKIEHYGAITAQRGVADVGEAPGMSEAERAQATNDWVAATGGARKPTSLGKL
jgi:predicted amidohydrolase